MRLIIFMIISFALIVLYILFSKPKKNNDDEEDNKTSLFNSSLKETDKTAEDVFEGLKKNNLESSFLKDDKS